MEELPPVVEPVVLPEVEPPVDPLFEEAAAAPVAADMLERLEEKPESAEFKLALTPDAAGFPVPVGVVPPVVAPVFVVLPLFDVAAGPGPQTICVTSPGWPLPPSNVFASG